MIPIRDKLPTRRVPIINFLLIAANVVVFILQWLSGSQNESITYQYALIPANFLSAPGNFGNVMDIFTSMFMHAGILHLAGNMLYLWIFGDNVEDRFGHIRYLLFYLAGGVIATFAHIFTNPASTLPTVGASGAIAAVLGAYLVLYPSSRIVTFIPIGFFLQLRLVPAAMVLVVWFVLQLFNGVLSLGQSDVGGTAFWAHIGGFITGVVAGWVVSRPQKPKTQTGW